jgi:hypothetical protein
MGIGNRDRASKSHPCRICEEANNWCLHLPDIGGMICMKFELPGCKIHKFRDGSIGYLYSPTYFNGGQKVEHIERPMPKVEIPETPLAPLELRHDVYSALLELMALSDEHEAHMLTARKIPADKLCNFGTLWEDREHRRSITKIIESAFELIGVPGFFRYWGEWTIAGYPGILIPYKTIDGMIQGFQIRRDGDVKQKYVWLSSPPDKFQQGTRSGTFSHFANAGRQPDVFICEGALKAEVTACNMGVFCIGLPGIPDIDEIVRAFGKGTLPRFILCPDADFRTNFHVYVRWENILHTLSGLTTEIRIATWEPDAGKGIDDLVLQTNQMPRHMSPGNWKSKFPCPPPPQNGRLSA